MEALKLQFERTKTHIDLVAEKLSGGQFLTQPDCFETMRLLNELCQEQSRCAALLGAAQADLSGLSLDKLEELLKASEQEQERRRIVEEFLSVRTADGKIGAELARFQTELAARGDEELARMEKRGELELYREFTGFAKEAAPDPERVYALSGQFGFELAFALLRHVFEFSEPDGPERSAGTAEAPAPAGKAAAEEDRGAESPVETVPVEEAPDKDSPEEAPADSSPAGEPVLLPDAFPIKKREANVNVFRSSMQKLPLAARILLPALSNLGVLNVELAVRFSELMGWELPETDPEAFTRQVADVFRRLSQRGFTAEYQTEEYGPVYCLTEYGYASLHKPTILREARTVFAVLTGKHSSYFISVRDHKLLGLAEMERDVLFAGLQMNQDMVRYLSFLRDLYGSSEDLEDVRQSISWKNGHYVIKTPPVEEQNILCRVCHSAEAADEGEPTLFLTRERPDGPFDNWISPVFFCDGSGFYRWDNGWVLLADAMPVDSDEDAPAPDGEPDPVTEESCAEEAGQEPGLPPEEAPTAPGEPAEKAAEPEARAERSAPDIDICRNSAQENAGLLLEQPDQIRIEQLVRLMVQLMAENRLAEAAALAETLESAPNADGWLKHFYRALQYSLQIPGRLYSYNSNVIVEQQEALPLTEDPDIRGLQQTLVLSTLLWAMAFPSLPYDYDLYNNVKMAADADERPVVQRLITLLSKDLKDISFNNDAMGFSPGIINSLADNGEQEDLLQNLCARAREELKRPLTTNIPIRGLETCRRMMAGPASPLGKALSWIAQNKREKAREIQTILNGELGSDHSDPDRGLEEYIDRCWAETRKVDSSIKIKQLRNESPARKICKKDLTSRVELVDNWLDLVNAGQSSNFRKYKAGYARIFNQLKDSLTELLQADEDDARAQPYAAAGQNILRFMARKMLEVLDGAPPAGDDDFFYDLCLTPELMLGENGENVIVPELYGVKGLEPWTFLLRCVAAGSEESGDILARIGDYRDSRWYGNLGSEALLRAYDSDEELPDQSLSIQDAEKAAEKELEEFRSKVRMSRAYGKIKESTMETAFSVLELGKQVIFRSHNYATFRRFLGLLEQWLQRDIEKQAVEYEKKVQSLEAGSQFAGAPILDTIRQALKERHFTILDSYINRLQSGERELPASEQSMDPSKDFLARFQESEPRYYRECQDPPRHRSDSPAIWGEKALESMGSRYQHWTSFNEKKKGCAWLSNWMTSINDKNNAYKVGELLRGLGFHIKSVVLDKSVRSATCEVFKVSAETTSTGLKDYPHPIYKFGTELSDPMYVVCLYGCKGASTLIRVMTNELHLNGPTIVLMEGSLSVADRHSVAAKFKADTSGQSPFLLIDRVLLLYLASLDAGDRQNAMLRCTLPYTFEVLYNSGSGAVPEEMFIGRVAEMIELRREQGPNLVYGGRQLGKTALLNRASKTLHDPANRDYSFCVDVKDKGSDVLLQRLNKELGKLKLVEGCGSFEQLRDALQAAYEEGRIRNLRVFVDEVDRLFEELQKSNFEGLRPFIDVENDTRHHIKFVFAGTHNVVASGSAEEGNSNLLHMGGKPLCIEPLSASDATKLIRIPMSYLGFEIGDSQIELILSNTNSYPGLIHMFCNALIQSVCRDYAAYYSGNKAGENPPYRISDEQMRAVFKETDIRKEIGRRVMATIKLNHKYHIVSCLLAQMVYEDQENERNRLYGYSARELLDYNQAELDIPLLRGMSEKSLNALLDEMVRMGILWKPEDEKIQQFRFRQQDFLSYIGDSEEVLGHLLDAAAREVE